MGIPGDDIVARSLERYSHDYWAGMVGRREVMIDYARALHKVVKPKKLVDVGCGPGWMLEYWVKEQPDVVAIGYDKCIGIARSVADPDVARRIFRDEIDRWRSEPPGGNFDLAICVNVFADLEGRDYEVLARGLVALAPTIFFAPSSPYWEGIFKQAEGTVPSADLLRRWRKEVQRREWTGQKVREKAQFFVRP